MLESVRKIDRHFVTDWARVEVFHTLLNLPQPHIPPADCTLDRELCPERIVADTRDTDVERRRGPEGLYTSDSSKWEPLRRS